MKESQGWLVRAAFILLFLVFLTTAVQADNGHWVITQPPIGSGNYPSINNSGEIVYSLEDGGIISSVRGTLAVSGFNPHLANSGEVVYADWFGGPNWDLVSTTRGQMTQGGIIDINASDYDVNTNGEIVYAMKDTNNFSQVYSTVRGQITFDAADHSNPCINDSGEIVWNQYIYPPGTVAFSSTRGILGPAPIVCGLNNSGDYCFFGNIENPPGYYTFPHIFSSAHGALINDPAQYQYGGDINDAATIVWNESFGVIYEANWVISGPAISLVSGPALEWPTSAEGLHVQYTTDLSLPDGWQALTGSVTTNGTNFHLAIGQNLGSVAYFRLSNVSP